MWNEVNITERTNKIMKKVSKKGVIFMKFKTLQVIAVIMVTTLVLTLSVSAIGKNHWAVDYVDFTYNTGILSDTRAGVGTSETITRGEMANAIVLLLFKKDTFGCFFLLILFPLGTKSEIKPRKMSRRRSKLRRLRWFPLWSVDKTILKREEQRAFQTYQKNRLKFS